MTAKHYVVEHLDAELEAWSKLEYLTIAEESIPKTDTVETASPTFHLTSLPEELYQNLPAELTAHKNLHATTEEVIKLAGLKPEEVVLLDPRAEKDMNPEDGETFRWFVFGGILGDDPPRDRTAELRKYGFTGRRLGPVQMTTDTAVRVTRLVVEDKIPLDKIPFVDFPELKFSKNEATEMPFRYVKTEDGAPIMPPVSPIVYSPPSVHRVKNQTTNKK
ncbi:hypothetical protein H072_4619 [Dactylellina haptotyla CBS 200.50]|uniref:DUF431-domain-containing protein n=1 Tax=Dactylellina haptotyla (strain CBS 200.50) TaxID=1284197 RepID=S8C1L7_DACHA|nr:hypothetical protein H072_4619 [Dactylellina haptotyla CBS 200.50]